MTGGKISGWRCACTAPNGKVLERKKTTRPYDFAIIRPDANGMGEGQTWSLVSMHQTRHNAISFYPEIVVPVRATPIYARKQ